MMMVNRLLAIPLWGAHSKRGKLARKLRTTRLLDCSAARSSGDGNGTAHPISPPTLQLACARARPRRPSSWQPSRLSARPPSRLYPVSLDRSPALLPAHLPARPHAPQPCPPPHPPLIHPTSPASGPLPIQHPVARSPGIPPTPPPAHSPARSLTTYSLAPRARMRARSTCAGSRTWAVLEAWHASGGGGNRMLLLGAKLPDPRSTGKAYVAATSARKRHGHIVYAASHAMPDLGHKVPLARYSRRYHSSG